MSRHNLLPASTGMPLVCSICPKKPNFSDVSHLLTHIGSKGHLVQYYKIEVKANTDAMSRRSLAEYREWYDEWNLQDMMSERLDQKERKKAGSVHSAGNSRRTSVANSNASGRSTLLVNTLPGRRTQALRENTIDPQLGPRIKIEPRSRSNTPGFLDAASMHRSYAPPMQGWPTTPYATGSLYPDGSAHDSIYDTSSGESDDEDYEVPARSTTRPKRRSTNKSIASSAMDDEGDDEPNDSTKLKGIIWPGMDLFDSATYKMRRKRNQKKATSVVEQLQATSEIIGATELVFDSEGVLRRERPITGEPEEHDGRSPLPGERTPEPEQAPGEKKVGRRPRPALTEKHVNSGRELRNKHNTRSKKSSRASKRSAYFDDADDDDGLTYGRQPARKKRSGLSIHRDNTGPDISFDRPASMNTLNSGFRNPFRNGPGQQYTSTSFPQIGNHRSHRHQLSFSYPHGFRGIHNPLGMPPPPNFGSFGQLSGHSMFPTFHNPHSFPFANGQQPLAAFPPQFTVPSQPFVPVNDGAAFTAASAGGTGQQAHHQSWDSMFANLGQPTDNLDVQQTGHEVNFHMNGDFEQVNPLFMSSAHAAPEDDEATVSPPSEH